MGNSRVLALGFFDGVHQGHAALLGEAKRLAKKLGASACALSFDASPAAFVQKQPVALISSEAERRYLIQNIFGLDEMLMLPFDQNMMQLSWQDFIETVLIAKFHAAAVVCGEDYRFGFHREGTAQKLRMACEKRGLKCSVVKKRTIDGQVVSSTLIRRFFAQGDFEKAVRFLAHPHIISGTVQHGNQKGRTINFPTVNIAFHEGMLVPSYGVYFGLAEFGKQTFTALCNIGVHPTVSGLKKPILEAHLIDYCGELYGQQILLKLYHFHRAERYFASLEELQTQILADKAACIDYISKHLDA